jgi:Zn-dependent protease with chaperone function
VIATAPRPSFRVGATVAALTVLGVAFPILFTLAVIVAGFALIYLAGHFAGFLLKLLWLLVFPLIAALRGLWIRPVYEAGQPLVALQSPELFATIERLRAAANAAPVHGVYLTGAMNASMVQIPRFGLFGGSRNELHLGLPLMIAMDEPHFTAVLAHEIGHLARRHGRSAARIYRIRITLDAMLGELQERRSPLQYPIALFYRVFVPRYDRATLELSRALELEADAGAAEAVGAQVAAEALTVIAGIAPYYSAELWPAIWRGADAEPEPPPDVYAVVAERLRSPLADGHRFLAAALSEQTSEHETHPALADRLRNLGFEPASMEALLERYTVPNRSAADVFLAGAVAQRRALAHEWWSAVRARWHQSNAELQQVRARLAELDALGETASAAERRERGVAASQLGRADAKALLLAASDASPRDADLALRTAAALREADDERSIAYAERAIESDVQTTGIALMIERAFFRQRNDLARAAECDLRLSRFSTVLTAASQERDRFTGAEPVEPHGLGDDLLAHVRRALDLPDLTAAYLARRQLAHLGDVPHFVLAIARKKTKYGTSDANIAKIISDDLAEFPYGVTVFVSTKQRTPVLEALRAVDGTQVV